MLNELGKNGELGTSQFCHQLRACLPSCSIIMNLGANESLYTCGEGDNNVYLIESGCAKILTLCQGGKECLLDIRSRGEILGESCILNGERAETVTMMTSSVLRVIPRKQLLKVIFDNGLLEESLKYLASKLSEQQQIITHFVTADSERRLAAVLLRLGRKLGKRRAGRLWLDERITQEELAGIVGTTRSRIGYFLKQFRAAKMIEEGPRFFMLINEEMLDEYIQTWS